MEKKFLALKDIDAYKRSLHLSNEIWTLVRKWDYFSRDTIGKQFVRAMDSVSANIAEGFGRYHKKDKILFYRYAYGSVHESMDWTLKSHMRRLLTEEEYSKTLSALRDLMPGLHHLIRFTNERLTH